MTEEQSKLITELLRNLVAISRQYTPSSTENMSDSMSRREIVGTFVNSLYTQKDGVTQKVRDQELFDEQLEDL